jgi:hypothetical protein
MADRRTEAIRERAYSLWEKEGRADGRDLDDWLRAEAEMTSGSLEAVDTVVIDGHDQISSSSNTFKVGNPSIGNLHQVTASLAEIAERLPANDKDVWEIFNSFSPIIVGLLVAIWGFTLLIYTINM